MAWRVPTLVGLGDLDDRPGEVAVVLELAERTAQPFIHHVAEQLRLGDRALSTATSRSRARASARASGRGCCDRPRCLRGLRRSDVRHPPRAGPAGRAGAGRTSARRRPRPRGPWRPGLAAVLAELGMEEEARRELAVSPSTGSTASRLAVAGVADLPGGCLQRRSATRTMAALVYPELEPCARAAT